MLKTTVWPEGRYEQGENIRKENNAGGRGSNNLENPLLPEIVARL